MKEKVTIYTTSEFMGNIIKYEGYLLEHGKRKYAQYDAAPFVDFVPKGKRKPVRIQKSYNPYLLIVEGWETPEPDPMCPPEGGMSKYSSFDEGWRRNFNAVLSTSDVKIIADYREKGGFKMNALETMKAELRRIQEAQAHCVTEWGGVKQECRYRFQILVRQEQELRESIKWMTELYAEKD